MFHNGPLGWKTKSVKIYKVGINHEQILHEYNSM